MGSTQLVQTQVQVYQHSETNKMRMNIIKKIIIIQ